MKDKKLSANQLLLRACILAEDYEEEFLCCLGKSDEEMKQRSISFIKQLRAYRMKRWGNSKRESVLSEMRSVPIPEAIGLAEVIHNPQDSI